MPDEIPAEVVPWLERFAVAVGTEVPSDAEIDALLGLAAAAARGSARQAAPIACWLAARADIAPADAAAIARTLSD